jgi:hypothetical protein
LLRLGWQFVVPFASVQPSVRGLDELRFREFDVLGIASGPSEDFLGVHTGLQNGF